MKPWSSVLISGAAIASLAISTTGAAQAANLTNSAAVSAYASQATTPPCDASGAGITAFTDCVGSYELAKGQNDVTNGGSNNLASQILNTGVFNGITDWIFDAKSDGSTSGPNTSGFSINGLKATSGSFNFNNIDLAITDLAISLKAATGFSIYYIKAGTVNASSINWNTLGVSTNPKGIPQGLSHASVYLHKHQPVTSVPEPASLLGLAIAAGTGLSLKRKKLAT